MRPEAGSQLGKAERFGTLRTRANAASAFGKLGSQLENGSETSPDDAVSFCEPTRSEIRSRFWVSDVNYSTFFSGPRRSADVGTPPFSGNPRFIATGLEVKNWLCGKVRMW
jgi:hypothetical protein